MGRFAYKEGWLEYTERDRAYVDEALEYLGIASLKERPLTTLSSGQEQLVLIATALVQQSDVIILDEPTANLDPQNSVKIARIMAQLKAEKTLIVITHDINLAQVLSDTVLFIEAGTTHLYGKDFFTQTVLEKHYKTPFSHAQTFGVVYE